MHIFRKKKKKGQVSNKHSWTHLGRLPARLSKCLVSKEVHDSLLSAEHDSVKDAEDIHRCLSSESNQAN